LGRRDKKKMDYSYLNHHHHQATTGAGGPFDPSSCAMPPGADGGVLAACNLAGAGPYGDLASRCGPAGPMGPSSQHAAAAVAAYGAYGAMRGHHSQYGGGVAPAAPPTPSPMSTGSCSMIPRPRDHPMQTPTMFASGKSAHAASSFHVIFVVSSCGRFLPPTSTHTSDHKLRAT